MYSGRVGSSCSTSDTRRSAEKRHKILYGNHVGQQYTKIDAKHVQIP